MCIFLKDFFKRKSYRGLIRCSIFVACYTTMSYMILSITSLLFVNMVDFVSPNDMIIAMFQYQCFIEPDCFEVLIS